MYVCARMNMYGVCTHVYVCVCVCGMCVCTERSLASGGTAPVCRDRETRAPPAKGHRMTDRSNKLTPSFFSWMMALSLKSYPSTLPTPPNDTVTLCVF